MRLGFLVTASAIVSCGGLVDESSSLQARGPTDPSGATSDGDGRGGVGGCAEPEPPTICQPGEAPQVLARGDYAARLVLDGDYVYFVTNEGVKRVPKRGGDVATIARTPIGKSFGLAVDCTYAYWDEWINEPSELHGGLIRRVPKSGGQAEVIARPSDWPFDMAVRGADLFWAQRGGIGRLRLSEATPKPQMIATRRETNMAYLVLDGDSVFFSIEAEVERVSVTGGPVTSLVGASVDTPLAVDADHVYWDDNKNAEVFRMNKSGEGRTPFVDRGAIDPSGIVLDERFLYFTSTAYPDPHASVFRANKDSGERTLVARIPEPSVGDALAVDTSCVYVSTSAPDRVAVWRVPK
jgi:hypothetical protein